MTSIPTDVHLRVAHGPAAESPNRQLLSAEELRRYDSFRSAQRRRCFAMGRATLRALLAEQLQIDPRDVLLDSAPDGALEVGESGLYASLSHTVTSSPHSEIVTAAAVAGRPVGIDVEAFKPRRKDLFERILTPEEYPLLEALGIPLERAHIVLWSLKEAALKANRSGLRLAMRHVGLEVDPERGRAVCTLPDARRLEGRYDIRDEFVVAIAFSA